MTSKLSYFFNSLTREHIIQLVIDQGDFLLVPTQLNRPGLDVSDHLVYLANIVQAINEAKDEEKSIMADFITDPAIDPILDADEPLPDMDNEEQEEEGENIDSEIPPDETDPDDEIDADYDREDDEEEEEEEELIDDDEEPDDEDDTI